MTRAQAAEAKAKITRLWNSGLLSDTAARRELKLIARAAKRS